MLLEFIGMDVIYLNYIWYCLLLLMTVTEHNRVHMILVLGHKGIADNETAYFLAKGGAEISCIGPDPA
jgi:hypothetical protein